MNTFLAKAHHNFENTNGGKRWCIKKEGIKGDEGINNILTTKIGREGERKF